LSLFLGVLSKRRWGAYTSDELIEALFLWTSMDLVSGLCMTLLLL